MQYVDSASIDYETGEKNRNKAHEIKDGRSETEIQIKKLHEISDGEKKSPASYTRRVNNKKNNSSNKNASLWIMTLILQHTSWRHAFYTYNASSRCICWCLRVGCRPLISGLN